MTKRLFFDMDGTIADLYGKPDWLERIQKEIPELYIDLRPMYDMNELTTICTQLKEEGWKIGIITWLPGFVSEAYEAVCAVEKREWIIQNFPIVEEVHIQKYGTPKHKAPYTQAKIEILVDDNDEVLATWATPKRRLTIDAKKNIINELKKLLDK